MIASRGGFLFSSAASALAVFAPMPAHADDRTTMRIGASSVEQQAEGYYADEQGFFKKAGLAVEIVPMKGGAATVAAVVGGSLNVGCSNPISFAQAVQRGVPLVMLLSGSIWDSRVPTGYAVVAPDSTLKSPKELENQVVAVPSLGGLDQLLLSAYIQQAGGNVANVKFVELSENATVDALGGGRVAMSYLDEPAFSAFSGRVRAFGPASNAIAKEFAQTVWFTSADWLAKNKDTAKKFVDAAQAGGKWAMANPEAAAAILEKRIGFKESRARVRFATTTDPTLIQVVLDAAAKYKVLPPMRATDYLWSGK